MTQPSTPPLAVAADQRLEAVLLRHEIEAFNTAYAATLDEQRLMDWAKLFTDDALYVVVSRENFERDLPVGLIYCENAGMIRDRAFAVQETSMFAPRYLRHMIANLSVVLADIAGIPQISAVLKSCTAALGILIAVILCFTLLLLVSTSVVMAAGLSG